MSNKLTTTSYAVLAQVAVRSWSTYELAQQRTRYFRYVWPRAESAIYREVRRLSAMGLIRGKNEYTGKRARTIYSITEAGIEELRQWLGTPITPMAMEFEALSRLFVAPLGTKEQLISTLNQVQEDAQQMLAFAGQVKQEFINGISATQDQVYIRAPAVDFFVSLLNMVNDWAERTLAEVGAWDDLTPAGKNERGLEIIRGLRAPAPLQAQDDIAVPPEGRRGRRS